MSERVKRSLHNEIMNLQAKPRGKPSPTMTAYKIGHKDARHAAAELAAEHEAIESALVEALERIIPKYREVVIDDWEGTSAFDGLMKIADDAEAALSLAYGETQ